MPFFPGELLRWVKQVNNLWGKGTEEGQKGGRVGGRRPKEGGILG